MSRDIDERVKDEIEALEAILMDDVTVNYNENGIPERIKTVVFPSTADDTKQQYVCITLEVQLVSDYPDCEPIIKLYNPRGLDDSLISDIQRAAKEKCIENLGQPVIFELIELIRERLTESNVPSCQCAVCLYSFKPQDEFTKTNCYHYFHSYCLGCHIVSTERHFIEEQEKLPAWQKQTSSFQPLCPVCREPIIHDLEQLKQASPPVDLENAKNFEVTAELKALQAKMSALYLYQQSRGGIIDVEAEESKLLVLTNSSTDQERDSPPLDRVPEQEADSPPGPSLTQQPQREYRGHRGGGYRGFNRQPRGNKGRGCRQSAGNR